MIGFCWTARLRHIIGITWASVSMSAGGNSPRSTARCISTRFTSIQGPTPARAAASTSRRSVLASISKPISTCNRTCWSSGASGTINAMASSRKLPVSGSRPGPTSNDTTTSPRSPWWPGRGMRQTGLVAQDAQEQPGWLLLTYRIPSEPTRLRAAVWRRLKGLGAIYLQNSVAALPASAANERALRKLHHDILGMSGTATLLSAAILVGQRDVVATFQASRDDEYEEIVDKCQDFLGQVAKEYQAEHFTFAELEENEEDLAKLRNWLAKVTERDVFAAPRREATLTALAKCEQALEDYAARVYAEQTDTQ